MNNKNIFWITKTAIFIALLVVVQAVTKPFGTLVTGSAVNFVLIAAALSGGLASGLTAAVISPFMAMLLGIVPLPIYIVPAVALGNAAIVFVYWFMLKRFKAANLGLGAVIWAGTIAVGAAVKYAVLYASVNLLIVPLVTAVSGSAKAPAAIYATSQMLTAAIGGALAMLIVPAIVKALKKTRGA